MTSSNEYIFRVTGHLCGDSPVPSEFLAQRPVMRSCDGFFYLRLNKRLSKQSWGWWFETLSRPLWGQRNGKCCLQTGGLFVQVSAPPSTAYMRQWIGSALVRIMAYSTPSHYLNQRGFIVNWTLKNNLQWNFDQNTAIFLLTRKMFPFDEVIIYTIYSRFVCVCFVVITLSLVVNPYDHFISTQFGTLASLEVGNGMMKSDEVALKWFVMLIISVWQQNPRKQGMCVHIKISRNALKMLNTAWI